MTLKSIVFLLLIFVLWACGSADQEKSCASPQLNPNGDSEMSLFMRKIAQECEINKGNIKDGKPLAFSINPDLILKAKMSKGHTMDSNYIIFAEEFISKFNAMVKVKEDTKLFYNAFIQNCINCHKTQCPGPIKRINKLRIK
jgi:hypothetical protein